MRAIAQERYGGPEVLELRELAAPPVGPDVVLVRVHAAGVNPVDWKIREGRLAGAFPSHFPLVPGWDVAGVVEAVGHAVPEWSPGDEVVGYVRRDHIQWGTYAELVPAPVRTLARKPASLSWAEAGALPLAGLTAWQALARALRVQQGDTLLIHAAGGGVGSFAVQLARELGARVIGTGSEASQDHVRSLGAEPVVYGDRLAAQVRELAPGGVTAVLDLVGGEALASSPALLAPGGRVASVVDAAGVVALGGTYVFVRPDVADLTHLAALADAGRLRVPLHATLPLEEAREAHRLVAGGHSRGKVVLEVA